MKKWLLNLLSAKVIEANHVVFDSKRVEKVEYCLGHHWRTAKVIFAVFRILMLLQIGVAHHRSYEAWGIFDSGFVRFWIRTVKREVEVEVIEILLQLEEVIKECPWATTGRIGGRKPNIITSLELRSEEMEIINNNIQKKYRECEEKEVRFEEYLLDDAEYAIMAFGSAARVAKKSIDNARAEGIKVGLLRPITLWPFPTKEVQRLASKVKGILSVEFNAGQMVEDIRLAVGGGIPVQHFGRLGGIIPDPDEVVEALKRMF